MSVGNLVKEFSLVIVKMVGFVLVLLFPIMAYLYWSTANSGNDEVSDRLAIKSPDKNWVIDVVERIHNNSVFTGFEVTRYEVYIRNVNQPPSSRKVIFMDDNGENDYLPRITWSGDSAIKIVITRGDEVLMWKPSITIEGKQNGNSQMITKEFDINVVPE